MATKSVRVIRTDRTGHYAGVLPVTEFEHYAWDAKQEVVVINGVQVNTLEDFLRAVDAAETDEPEVLFFPPLAGGR
jgi:hypothetical protein